MKNVVRILLLALLSVALLLPNAANAKVKRAKAKPSLTPTSITIQSIAGNTITVKEPQGTKSYTVTTATEITYEGQRVALSFLKAGMHVDVSAGMDLTVASVITASGGGK